MNGASELRDTNKVLKIFGNMNDDININRNIHLVSSGTDNIIIFLCEVNLSTYINI